MQKITPAISKALKKMNANEYFIQQKLFAPNEAHFFCLKNREAIELDFLIRQQTLKALIRRKFVDEIFHDYSDKHNIFYRITELGKQAIKN